MSALQVIFFGLAPAALLTFLANSFWLLTPSSMSAGGGLIYLTGLWVFALNTIHIKGSKNFKRPLVLTVWLPFSFLATCGYIYGYFFSLK